MEVASFRFTALACAMILVCCHPVCAMEGKRVEVDSIPTLVEALNDPTITNVVINAPELALYEGEMPFNAAVIAGRNVTLEGATQPDGSLMRLDANALGARVLVDNSSVLTQRNVWVDDCFLEGFPYTCFATPGPGGGRIGFEDGIFSDATCATLDESTGIANMIMAAKAVQSGEYKEEDISDREIRIVETGWVPYALDGAAWRMKNVTVSCTAGVTHPDVEEDKKDPVPVPPASSARVAAAWAAAGGAVAVAVYI